MILIKLVFLSSTGTDLEKYRSMVLKTIAKYEHFLCIAMESFGARDASSLEFCKSKVEACDLFVGLIGHYRGSEVPTDRLKRSITEFEYDWASASGKPRLMFLLPEGATQVKNVPSTPGQIKRQRLFRRRLMASHVVDMSCSTPNELASSVMAALANYLVRDMISKTDNRFTKTANADLQQALDAVATISDKTSVEPKPLMPNGIDINYFEDMLQRHATSLEEQSKETAQLSARFYIHVGALAHLHDTIKAMLAYTKATKLAPNNPNAWFRLGDLQYRAAHLNEALSSFNEIMKIATKTKDPAWKATAQNRIGYIYMLQGKLDDAERLFRASLKLEIKLRRPVGIALNRGYLGVIYRDRGRLSKAERLLKSQLRLAKSHRLFDQQAIANGGLGVLHIRRQNYHAAELNYRRQLEIATKHGIVEQIGRAYGNLGRIYEIRGKLDEATTMYQEGLVIDKQLGRKEGIAAKIGNLGQVELARGNFSTAKTYSRQCLKIAKKNGFMQMTAVEYGHLGKIYAAQRNAALACKQWSKAIAIYRNIQMPHFAKEIRGWMADAGCSRR